MSDFRFDEAEFRARAAARLLKDVPEAIARSDYDLNPDLEAIDPLKPSRAAAVLIPIVLHQPELTVLLTQRTELQAAQATGYTAPALVDFAGARYEELDGEAEAVDQLRNASFGV